MKCVIGLSGGVDSAVSAALLQKQGYEVVACTFRMFAAENATVEDARKVADFLHIQHEIVDCSKDFKTCVMDYFVEKYNYGQTPNPCIMCNQLVKFKYLDEFRKKHNADFLATGHYARLNRNKNGIELLKAAYLPKDQSYFLYRVHRDILQHVIFPVGEYSKQQVRDMAVDMRIPAATKADSQDVCFINGMSYVDFVKRNSNVTALDGDIVDRNGNILGRHHGTINYTIGQRKGLGLAGGPYFVCRIDSANNLVIVSDKSGVQRNVIRLNSVRFINEEFLGECNVKIRSANKQVPAEVYKNENGYFVKLHKPEYGVAAGQHCVFFLDDIVLGGGVIE